MSDTPEYSVDNGRRVLVDFGFYAGEAGTRQREDTIDVAFPAKMPNGTPPNSGRVNGQLVEVVTIRKSAVTRGMLLLVVRPA